jgi:hypothetical protein
MRTKGSPEEREHRRRLAVRQYLDGYSADEIAKFRHRGPDRLSAGREASAEAYNHARGGHPTLGD